MAGGFANGERKPSPARSRGRFWSGIRFTARKTPTQTESSRSKKFTPPAGPSTRRSPRSSTNWATGRSGGCFSAPSASSGNNPINHEVAKSTKRPRIQTKRGLQLIHLPRAQQREHFRVAPSSLDRAVDGADDFKAGGTNVEFHRLD